MAQPRVTSRPPALTSSQPGSGDATYLFRCIVLIIAVVSAAASSAVSTSETDSEPAASSWYESELDVDHNATDAAATASDDAGSVCPAECTCTGREVVRCIAYDSIAAFPTFANRMAMQFITEM